MPGTKRKPIDLLFLHGNAFNSEVWEEIKSLQIMAAVGFRCFAIDLLGKNNKQLKTIQIPLIFI